MEIIHIDKETKVLDRGSSIKFSDSINAGLVNWFVAIKIILRVKIVIVVSSQEALSIGREARVYVIVSI